MGGRQVPVDTSTASSQAAPAAPAPSMLLLTGPNYSGKSVYMKQVSTSLKQALSYHVTAFIQVALIVYLAQIGRYVKSSPHANDFQLSSHSFVPADSAELGITDKILTKINTQESVSKVC